jgi:sugar phosphate permease
MAETGVAAGLVNTSYQIGSAVGLAALTAVAAGVTASGTDVAVLTDGYSAAFLGAAVIAVLGLVAAAAFLRTNRAAQPEAARETVDA